MMRAYLITIAAAILSALGLAPTTSLANEADVDAFAQLPIMTAATMSPDGTRVAFLSALNGRYHVVIERFRPEFERYILYPSDDADFRWVEWANDDRLLISASFAAERYLADTTETRLYSVGPYGQNLTPIIKSAMHKGDGSHIAKELPPPQIQDNVIDYLANDADHVLVSLDADLNNRTEVHRVNIHDGSYTEEVADFAKNSRWISDQSGEVRLASVVDFGRQRASVRFKGADGTWRRIRDASWLDAGFRPLAFAAEPNVIYTIGRNDAGISVIRTVDLTSGRFIETISESDSVDSINLVYTDKGSKPVGIHQGGDIPIIYYFDPEFQKLQRSIDAALKGTVNKIVSTSAARRQVLIFSHSDTNLGTYYIWDRDGGGLSLYSDQTNKLNQGMLSPIRRLSYAARDGLDIPAYLTLPKDVPAENLPVVVMPHGGPHDRVDMSYDFLSQFLAAQGYAVFRPNFRGSTGYGSDFETAGKNEWGGKMQDDVTDGARWLIEEGIADADRMCIVGWSYGGYSAAMGLIKTPELFQCGVSINGVLNLPRLILDTNRYLDGDEMVKSIGLQGERAKTVSPYHLAERITAPILIIQSTDDVIVPKDQAHGMVKQLKKLKKQYEYVEIEYGGHSMQNVDGRKVILASLEAFLREHLQH